MKGRNHLVFFLNGREVHLSGEPVFKPLSSYVREDTGLCGTKVVCAEGDCGACCVMVAFPARKNPTGLRSPFRLINSCITPMCLFDGASIVTVEGLKSQDGTLSPAQQSMVQCHGSQCGFCTPGFVMALTHLTEQRSSWETQDVKNYLTGNLCRCTGYEPIVEAAMSLSASKSRSLIERYLTPAIAKKLVQASKEPFHVECGAKSAVGPVSSVAVAKALSKKTVRLVASGTDLGVVHNKERIDLFEVVTAHKVAQVYDLKETKSEVIVGSGVDLETLRRFTKSSLPEFSRFLNLFASPPIRNIATLAANIANASPIADTPPFLLAMDARLEIAGPRGKRVRPMQGFYRGYKQIDLKPGEWITRVIIPKPASDEVVRLFKVSQRRDLDISTVNAAFRWRKRGDRLENVRIAYGGVGPTVLRLTSVEKRLSDGPLDRNLLERVVKQIGETVTPLTDMRAGEDYRRRLCRNLFRQFVREQGGLA